MPWRPRVDEQNSVSSVLGDVCAGPAYAGAVMSCHPQMLWRARDSGACALTSDSGNGVRSP